MAAKWYCEGTPSLGPKAPRCPSARTITAFSQMTMLAGPASSLLFPPTDPMQMSAARAEGFNMSIWMPFLSGHSLPQYVGLDQWHQPAGEDVSQAGQIRSRLEVRQSGD